jgi:hypothetical protein
MLLKGKPLLMQGINNRFLGHSDHSPITGLTELLVFVTAVQWVMGTFPDRKWAHPYSALRLRMGIAISLLPSVPAWNVIGQPSPLLSKMTYVSGQLGPCQVPESEYDRLLSNPQLLINVVHSVATKCIQRSLV